MLKVSRLAGRFAALFVMMVVAMIALPAQAGLRVVATTPDLAAIAAEVGKDKAKVTALVLPTQDPHFVDAKPNLALELSQADMLVVVGLDLEIGWLPNLLLGARNAKLQAGAPGYFDASQLVGLLDVPSGPVDRSMGDLHPGGNPHYLYDPRNAIPIAHGIAARMAQLDAANADAYRANADAFGAQVQAKAAAWQQQLKGLGGKEIVTYHRSFSYLAAWLGFTVPVTIEPKPGIPPSPAHIATVMTTILQKKIGIILQEEYYPASTAELVKSKTSASLVRMPGGTNFQGGETFLQRMERSVAMLAAVAK